MLKIELKNGSFLKAGRLQGIDLIESLLCDLCVRSTLHTPLHRPLQHARDKEVPECVWTGLSDLRSTQSGNFT